jgi:hypothetical protein
MELASPDNQAVVFEVTATGFLGAKSVVLRAARLSFYPGHTRVLPLFLDRACKGATGDPCTKTIDIDVNTLQPYDPKKPILSLLDAGVDSQGAADGHGSEMGGGELGADVRPIDDAAPEPSVADAPGTAAAADGPIPGPDAGADIPLDLPLGHDVASDVASYPDWSDLLSLADATVLGLDAIATCELSSDACPRLGDGAADSPVVILDVGRDVPGDALEGGDVLPDAGADLALQVDLGQDLAVPDGPSVCILPMTTCTGACIDPRTSLGNCGGCGQACSSKDGTPSCAAGACSMSSCSSGFLNCSADENASRDGCETNGNTDSANCGRCGNPCSSKVCRNQTCLATARYGNTGPGIDISAFEAGYLAGTQVYIPGASTVTGFGVVFYNLTASASMYLGLYTDVTGNPGHLVATVSAPALVAPGGKEIGVAPPVDVPAGTYWILGVWDVLASFSTNVTTTVTWRYASYPFGTLPTTAPTSMTPISLPPPNVYVIVAQ